MERIVLTKSLITDAGILGLAMMQVCAARDATDKEILKVCNRENPSGTSGGWGEVIRIEDPTSPYRGKNKLPVQCEKFPDRMHFLVLC